MTVDDKKCFKRNYSKQNDCRQNFFGQNDSWKTDYRKNDYSQNDYWKVAAHGESFRLC